MSKRVGYQVYGTVQGVNFRSYTVKQGSQLKLTGFVQNASDGTVVGEAQGDQSALNQFVQHLHKGPPAAKVDRVEIKDISVKSGETGFGQQ